MKAFVSSTFADLKEHRAHVIKCLRKAGIQVDPMEDWTAASQEPKTFCQARADGCDLCVLLVARRRGYIPPGESRSITQIEYDYVIQKHMEVLVFVLDDKALWHRNHDDLDRDGEVVRWRQKLSERHVVESFQHEPQSIDVAPAISRWLSNRINVAKVETSPFTIEWHVFAPFCPGIEVATNVLPSTFKLVESTSDLSRFCCSEIPDVALTWFSFGGAVWTIRHEGVFESLGQFALTRQRLYRDILKGAHPVRQMTKQILDAISSQHGERQAFQQPIGYALSSCFVTRSEWPETFMGNALQILACPNVLLGNRRVEDDDDEKVGEIVLDREKNCLLVGVMGADFKEYSLPNVIQGCACWAGVSAYIEPNSRSELGKACVAYQEQLQSLWWRLHSYESLFEEVALNTATLEQLRRVNRFVHKILRVGPTEVTALRLFKEAVVTTSRIEAVWNDFKSNLQI